MTKQMRMRFPLVLVSLGVLALGSYVSQAAAQTATVEVITVGQYMQVRTLPGPHRVYMNGALELAAAASLARTVPFCLKKGVGRNEAEAAIVAWQKKLGADPAKFFVSNATPLGQALFQAFSAAYPCAPAGTTSDAELRVT